MTTPPRITALHPRLAVSDAARAIEFYRTALGAEELARYTGPDGQVVHAEIRLGEFVVAVKDGDQYDPAPESVGGTPVVLSLQVEDVDALGEAMLRAGATVIFPIQDQPYGERAGRLADPFGHQWMVSQRTEDLTPAEVQRRTDAMFGG